MASTASPSTVPTTSPSSVVQASGPTTSSAVPPMPTTTSKTAQQQQYELRFQTMMHPPILPWDMFDGLERHSVDGLCSIGREVVHDLVARAMNLLSIIRINAIKMNSNTSHFSVETVLVYCNFLFEKLVEIQAIIEGRCRNEGKNAHLPDQELVDLLVGPCLEEVGRKAQLRDEFEQNRAKIIELNCQLKQLEWLSSVSDPRLIKKVDSLGETKR